MVPVAVPEPAPADRNARRVGGRAPGVGRRHIDPDRRRGDSLPRLRDSRRQGGLQPDDHRAGSRRPSAGYRRAQRRAHQRHARRHAAEHAHRALLQRERLAGRARHGAHRGVFDADPAAVLGPRAARRTARAATESSTAPSPTAGFLTPTGGSSRTPSTWTTKGVDRQMRSSSFLGFRSFICPICTIRPTRRAG